MPIDRTLFNLWADDDGSNTVGTLINKSRIDNDILDPIDDALAVTEQTDSATGTSNNFNLNGHVTYLRVNNASPRIYTGFTVLSAAPQIGDRVIIENIASSTVRTTHQDAGSTDAHKNITPSTNGQIVGAGGRMEGIYDGTTDRWRFHVIDPGAAITVAYSAGNFTGNGSMTWTVDSADQVVFKYIQRGRWVTVFATLNETTVGGTPSTQLLVTIPGGFTVTSTLELPVMRATDNGTVLNAFMYLSGGSTQIAARRADTSNWTASTNATYINVWCEFEVN